MYIHTCVSKSVWICIRIIKYKYKGSANLYLFIVWRRKRIPLKILRSFPVCNLFVSFSNGIFLLHTLNYSDIPLLEWSCEKLKHILKTGELSFFSKIGFNLLWFYTLPMYLKIVDRHTCIKHCLRVVELYLCIH